MQPDPAVFVLAHHIGSCLLVFVVSAHKRAAEETQFSFFGLRNDFGSSRFYQTELKTGQRLSKASLLQFNITAGSKTDRTACFSQAVARQEGSSAVVAVENLVVTLHQVRGNQVSACYCVDNEGEILSFQKRIHALIHCRNSCQNLDFLLENQVCTLLRVELRRENHAHTAAERSVNACNHSKCMEDRKDG